jgi:hypothetical protein
VAFVAARAMSRRGARIPDPLIARLAQSPLTRHRLHELLGDLGQARRIPAQWRTSRALAESRVIRELLEEGDTHESLPTLTWVAQRERPTPDGPVVVEVFEVAWGGVAGGLERSHVAVGPFARGPMSRERAERIPDIGTEWSGTEMDARGSDEASVDVLVDSAMDAAWPDGFSQHDEGEGDSDHGDLGYSSGEELP